MNTRRLLLCAATVFATTSAHAADPFPTKPVTLVTTFAPGSGPDAVLRLVAEKLGKTWNQRVIVENKPGGGGFIAIDAVKRAAPEKRHPEPPLLPADPAGRARVRALAAIVGCDIHPVNNRRILEALRHDFGADEAAVNRWCGTWISAGFDAIEALLVADTRRGDLCFGDAPTLADVYLIPQVESARRFKVDMTRWPLIGAVDAACSELQAFRDAASAAQPDAG